MNRRWTFLIVLCVFAIIEFFVSNYSLRGYLRSEKFLAKEIKTPLDSLDEYKIAGEAPFKYRPVFPFLVTATYRIVSDGHEPDIFFHTYRVWSLTFYVSSAVAMFLLLGACGFSEIESLSGAVVFLLLPAMLMAYTLPVHTREDALGYTLFFTALAFMLKGKKWIFLCISIVGALTRETLLLLPLLYLVFAHDENLFRRVAIALIPVIAWFLNRLLIGPADYDVWEGLRWNINNPEQVIGFLFIAFNVLWLTYLTHLSRYNKYPHYISIDCRFFYRSSPFVLTLILVTTFFGGIYNEIRLLHLFSPWMIIIFIDIIRSHNLVIRETLGSGLYQIYAVSVLLGCGVALYFLLINSGDLIVPGKYAVPYDLWIVLSMGYIFIFLLAIPPFLKIYSSKNFK